MLKIQELNKANRQDFFSVAINIYSADNNWVCPLNSEVDNIFNPEKNKILQKGSSKRWILYDDNLPVGRITAFWTEVKSKKSKPYSGGIGFFECIDSQESANLLFETAINWLKSEGMQTADACTIPGENYNYWGVLIDGFIQQGFGMPYNPPYYKDLFENFGFQTYYEQYSYHVDLTKPFPERHVSFAMHVINSGEFEFCHLDFRHLDKYITAATKVFNDVWSIFHADYVPADESDFRAMFDDIKPIVRAEFIWFVFKDGIPIGMEVCLPDINKVIKPFKGKLNLINKVRAFFKLKNVDRARLLVFGVHPDFHRKGVMQALFLKMTESLKKAGVKELEMSWVGDYNPTVNKLYSHLGNATHAKTHATFRYVIDKSVQFERFTNE